MFSGCDAARGMTTCEAHEAKQQWKPAGIVGEYIIYSDYIILYICFFKHNYIYIYDPIPSGKLTVRELENHHAINGKINYFYGHVQ